MRNLRLKLKFVGTKFHGWQIQENAKSVQGEIQKAVDRIFGDNSPVYGCSRTDAGVHANEYYCNFHTNKTIPCGKTVDAVNANIDDDISVISCDEVDADFHSRYDCKSKEYIYLIRNSSVRDPFLNGRVWLYKYKLDEELMNKAAINFIGKYDFASFCSTGSSVVDTVRTVTDAKVERDGDILKFTVSADGFLYNMVRIMTGTLVNVSENKIGPDDIKKIILSKDRSLAGITAPPQGLYLNRVLYEK